MPNDSGTYVWDADHNQWTNLGQFIGEKGEQGIQGPQGPTGATGAQGLQGPAGADGKDGSSFWTATLSAEEPTKFANGT